MKPKPAKAVHRAADTPARATPGNAADKPAASIPDRTRAIPKSVVARALEGVRYASAGIAAALSARRDRCDRSRGFPGD